MSQQTWTQEGYRVWAVEGDNTGGGLASEAITYTKDGFIRWRENGSTRVEPIPAPNPATTTIAPTSTGVVPKSTAAAESSSSNPPQASSTAPASGSTTATSGANINTSASQVPTESPKPDASKLSNGAIAGIGIGCAVVGLVIGILAAFFLFRRRKRTNNRDGAGIIITDDAKSHSLMDVASSKNIQLSQFLLEPTPDNQIETEMRSLDDLIHHHIESHYHSMPIRAGTSVLAQSLQKLGLPHGGDQSAAAIAALCIDPKTRQNGLRHAISQVIFKSIDSHSPATLKMLPPPIAAFLQSIPAGAKNTGKKPQKAAGRANADAENQLATAMALSQWSALSTFLLHPQRSDRTPLPMSEATMSNQAEALVQALSNFLQYFTSPDRDGQQQQQKHLQAVILECAKLGHVLLSHPSDWQFIFEERAAAASRRVIVLFPGLEKLGDAHGVPYNSPRLCLAPVAVSL